MSSAAVIYMLPLAFRPRQKETAAFLITGANCVPDWLTGSVRK